MDQHIPTAARGGVGIDTAVDLPPLLRGARIAVSCPHQLGCRDLGCPVPFLSSVVTNPNHPPGISRCPRISSSPNVKVFSHFFLVNYVLLLLVVVGEFFFLFIVAFFHCCTLLLTAIPNKHPHLTNIERRLRLRLPCSHPDHHSSFPSQYTAPLLSVSCVTPERGRRPPAQPRAAPYVPEPPLLS